MAKLYHFLRCRRRGAVQGPAQSLSRCEQASIRLLAQSSTDRPIRVQVVPRIMVLRAWPARRPGPALGPAATAQEPRRRAVPGPLDRCRRTARASYGMSPQSKLHAGRAKYGCAGDRRRRSLAASRAGHPPAPRRRAGTVTMTVTVTAWPAAQFQT